jgi:hypothetical protein
LRAARRICTFSAEVFRYGQNRSPQPPR